MLTMSHHRKHELPSQGFTLPIRLATPEDVGGIARVHVEGWRNTYPGVVPDTFLRNLSLEASAYRWQGVIASQKKGVGRTLVAEHPHHGVVGFIGVGPQRTSLSGFSGEFYALYVLDAFQGQGIGRALLTAGAAELRRRGNRTGLSWVLDGNPGRWFCERLGGVQVAQRMLEVGDARLPEVAYGWTDLVPLARLWEGAGVR